MQRVVLVAFMLASSCRDPSPPGTTDAAPAATPGTSVAAPPATAPVSAPSASGVAPASSASAPASTRLCPDAGPPKDSPITLVYTQVYVPDRGSRVGTTFLVAFRGQSVPVPQADVIYSWCSAEKTEDPTSFELRCHQRARPVCTIRIRDESVAFECGSVKRDVEVPCGVRPTLRLGRLPGTVAYH